MKVTHWIRADGTRIAIDSLEDMTLTAAIRGTRKDIEEWVKQQVLAPKKLTVGLHIIRFTRLVDAYEPLMYEAGKRGLTIDVFDKNAIIEFVDVGKPDFSIGPVEPFNPRASRSLNVQEIP